MPVPPIYQPEVAGRAVAHVAERPRRQLFVGLPTVLTVLANRLAPALVDRHLARTNVDAQQSPDHAPSDAGANTWEPVPGDDIAAHGVFDEQAHAHSPQLWVNQRRRWVVAAAAIAGLAATARGLRTASGG